MRKNFGELEKNIRIKFKDRNLLEQALTHRSYLNEHPGQKISSNERLEFLGDALLESFISKALFKRYPDVPEGVLTNMRSQIVCTKTLAKLGEKLGLGDFLLFSKGEEASGGRENKSLLANTVEALIGAIFLDGGAKQAEEFVLANLNWLVLNFNPKSLKDPKSLLQEVSQEKFKLTPSYKIVSEKGPDHAKIFKVAVFAGKLKLAEGKGGSKQEAEIKAAQVALEKHWPSRV